MILSKFQKNLKKSLDVGNAGIYICAKLQREIPYIWSCIKMTNLTDLEILKSCTVHYYRCQILSFLLSPGYMVFRVGILHVLISQHCLQQYYFHVFLNIWTAGFEFFKNRATCSSVYTDGFRSMNTLWSGPYVIETTNGTFDRKKNANYAEIFLCTLLMWFASNHDSSMLIRVRVATTSTHTYYCLAPYIDLEKARHVL
jgi:hypothetical protein